MSKKLVLLDIDGTSFVDGVMPSNLKVVLEQAKADGHLVGFVTGRSMPMYKRVVSQFTPNCECIINGGGTIIKGSSVEWTFAFSLPALKLVEQVVKGLQYNALVFGTGSGFYFQCSGTYEIADKLQDMVVHRTSSLEAFLMQVYVQQATKLTLLTDGVPVVLPQVDGLCITSNEGYMDITADGIHKLHAVRTVAELNKIPLQDVIIAGNDRNDLIMFEESSIGVRISIGDYQDLLQYATHLVDSPQQLHTVLATLL